MLQLSNSVNVADDSVNEDHMNMTQQTTGFHEGSDGPVLHRELMPSSFKQQCLPEPVKDGHQRMELSLDMIQKLSDLFGLLHVNNFYK